MEGIFQLSPENSLTVAAIEAILAGQLAIKYTPASAEAPEMFSASDSAQIKPADLMVFAVGLGSEMPTEITRLFLLLQADALVKSNQSFGNAASRLLDFYQFDIFPQVFNQGLLATPTAHLLQPVFGRGKVYYQGYLLQAADIHDIFSWEPINWPSYLPATILQDFSFGLSYAVYTLSQFRKIYRFTQLLLPGAFGNEQNLFSEQINGLLEQLNQELAQPQNQALHLTGITKQI